jgi:hypothetical protein
MPRGDWGDWDTGNTIVVYGGKPLGFAVFNKIGYGADEEVCHQRIVYRGGAILKP